MDTYRIVIEGTIRYVNYVEASNYEDAEAMAVAEFENDPFNIDTELTYFEVVDGDGPL